MRPHQCCCLPAAEKTYCSAALISSPRAAFFLLHHAHQHAHRVRSYSASCRYQSDTVFYHSAHHLRFMAFVLVYEPYFPAASIRVHRQSSFRIFIKGIASPKLPCELWSETDRAFQAVRPCSLEPAFFFNSYHLDRFGHSVLASLVSLQDISSVTIGLTSFKRFGFRHLFRKVSGGCRPGL